MNLICTRECSCGLDVPPPLAGAAGQGAHGADAAAGEAAHERHEHPVAHQVHEGELVGGARALVVLIGLLVIPLREYS